jgi:pimeloyl-ACP methyl ester carboxylesterase
MIQRLAAIALLGGVVAGAAPAVTDLAAEYRSGQVFLTWREAPVPPGTTFTVYGARTPILDAAALAGARKLSAGIEPASAEDWTRDPGTYGKGRQKDPQTGQVPPPPAPVGFIIRESGPRLDPATGLHVHTVASDEAGEGCYAVTTVHADGQEDRALVAGANTLATPVVQQCAPIQPIWQGEGEGVAPGAGRGKALHLQLHAKGNRPACKYIVFGDATHAWREGIPFMFDVRVGEDAVTLLPSDTLYVGRSFTRTPEGIRGVRGIWTFWYGGSDRIPDAGQIDQGTPTNYTERRLLFEIAWVQQILQTDPDRTTCSGSSMGGCGAISFAFRHPEIFAAVSAHVPIVAYDHGDPAKGEALGWHDNTVRLQPFCGPLSLVCSDGMPLAQRLDATAFVLAHPDDLPFLVIANGRQDTSIPWHNNPDFYRALQTMRQGCLVAWNDGTHGDVEKLLPADLREWQNAALARFARNRSFPAFSNGSRNQDPGNGDNRSGDTVGYMNRGLNWTDPVETATRYEVLITYDLDAADLPLTVDVTPRRCQAFRLAPDQACLAVNLDAAGREVQSLRLQADRGGRVTFPQFKLTGRAGNRLVLSR